MSIVDTSTLEEKISCTEPGCNKTMYLKDGQFGPFYSHKEESAPKGYHTINADKVETGTRTKSPLNHPTETREKVGEPDWDGIARGKTRCAVFTAVVAKDGLDAALAQKASIEVAVSFIMNGMDNTAAEDEF